jgi:hypothetical protein
MTPEQSAAHNRKLKLEEAELDRLEVEGKALVAILNPIKAKLDRGEELTAQERAQALDADGKLRVIVERMSFMSKRARAMSAIYKKELAHVSH